MDLMQWRPFDDDLFEFPLALRRFGGDYAIDLYEEGGSLIAKTNVPGISPEDIDINVEENMLTISGARREDKEVKEKDYYRKEIRRGSFSRSIRLPKAVDAERTTAEYADGVLTVMMPMVAGERKGGVKISVNHEEERPE